MAYSDQSSQLQKSLKLTCEHRHNENWFDVSETI